MTEHEKLLIEYMQRIIELARDDRPGPGVRHLPYKARHVLPKALRQAIIDVAAAGLFKVGAPLEPGQPIETDHWEYDSRKAIFSEKRHIS